MKLEWIGCWLAALLATASFAQRPPGTTPSGQATPDLAKESANITVNRVGRDGRVACGCRCLASNGETLCVTPPNAEGACTSNFTVFTRKGATCGAGVDELPGGGRCRGFRDGGLAPEEGELMCDTDPSIPDRTHE